MDNIFISVAKDFSLTPGPRYKTEGKFSGEEFREKVLNDKFKQAIKENKILTINLDGTFGYGTSFLEEAFGGLARMHKNGTDILKHIDFISKEEPYLIDDITNYVRDVD